MLANEEPLRPCCVAIITSQIITNELFDLSFKRSTWNHYSATDESKQGIPYTNSYVNLGDQENNYTEISSNCTHESSNENN